MSGCQRRALACRRGLLCQQDGAIQVATSEVEPGLPAGMSGLVAIDLNESKRESGGETGILGGSADGHCENEV